METWDLLKRELAVYGIELLNRKQCRCADGGKSRVHFIANKIKHIESLISKNVSLFRELWDDLDVLIGQRCENDKNPIDVKLRKLFISSIKGLSSFVSMLRIGCGEAAIRLKELDDSLRCALSTDILLFPNRVIKQVPDYKITIDWIFRRNAILSYTSKLLRCAQLGASKANKLEIKMALHTSGPWANLDLAMKERVFEWSDISEEVAGTTRDKQHQRRYRQAFEAYNNGEGVGEGYYWNEIRNEPYSYYNSSFESPYPHRYISKW